MARLRAAAPNERVAHFTSGDVRAAWERASILARREVVETLFTVTISPQGIGKRFDPEAVAIEWAAA